MDDESGACGSGNCAMNGAGRPLEREALPGRSTRLIDCCAVNALPPVLVRDRVIDAWRGHVAQAVDFRYCSSEIDCYRAVRHQHQGHRRPFTVLQGFMLND